MLKRSRIIVASVAVALAMTGCAGMPDSEATRVPSSTFTASVPPDGVSLRSAGVSHAPVGFSVPRGLRTEQVIDQENVVTLVVPGDQASLLETYLRANLEGMGFSITAEAPGSLVFVTKGWGGAFTTGDGIAGLTLRRDPSTFITPVR